MTLQLLHSEFPYTVYKENFISFFISVEEQKWENMFTCSRGNTNKYI